MKPVSRAYEKLKFAIEEFEVNVNGKTCADFGSSTGGFVQVLLEKNCSKVYSIETSKNRLHFVLKDDKRVIVLDKTNAVHVQLPEKVDLITIDVGWTPQKLILPNAIKNLKPNGLIISLIKPHYEKGNSIIDEKDIQEILSKVKKEIKDYAKVIKEIESPLVGLKGGNREFLWLIKSKPKQT